MRLPHMLKFFVVCVSQFDLSVYLIKLRCHSQQPATSLGGVESLIEQRVHADANEDPRLLRISVGVEDVDVCFSLLDYPQLRSDAHHRI